MSDDLSTIYKRLAKLLAMAQDTSSPQEAANASRMAETLMRKYQIEHADIIIKELKTDDPSSFGKTDLGGQFDQTKFHVKEIDKNLQYLAISIANLNDAQAKAVSDEHFGKMIRFQGYKPDVAICKFMFRYILKHMEISARKELDYSVDFKGGFITAVCEELKKALQEKSIATKSTGNSLVVIKTDAVAKHFGEANYRIVSHSVKQTEARNRGYQSGKQMDVLRRGVKGTVSEPIKIK